MSEAISPLQHRTQADTLVAEVLPLLEACKFLEKNAATLLKQRRLGTTGQPLWLRGIRAEVHREPFGHVLVIGPSNFPLFLPGTQVLQALAAGNTVTWKPGEGGGAVAMVFAQTMFDAGLPPGALTILGETIDAAQRAIGTKPDKIVFTGSANSGRAVLKALADTSTPTVLELSGADALVVMPGADLAAVAKAVAFGLRLNGGAVCMSPRRLLATATSLARLRPLLQQELNRVAPVALSERTSQFLRDLVCDATSQGAKLLGELHTGNQKPLLIDRAEPGMAIARSDIFAPVLSLLEVRSMMHVPEAYAECPFALTLSIFCGKKEIKQALALSRTMKAGTVLINDLIAPTADPRTPFGGRGASGYGVTRGAEGFLEMTQIKTVLVRRRGRQKHFEPTTEADTSLFAAVISALHGSGWKQRLRAVREILRSVKARQ